MVDPDVVDETGREDVDPVDDGPIGGSRPDEPHELRVEEEEAVDPQMEDGMAVVLLLLLVVGVAIGDDEPFDDFISWICWSATATIMMMLRRSTDRQSIREEEEQEEENRDEKVIERTLRQVRRADQVEGRRTVCV